MFCHAFCEVLYNLSYDFTAGLHEVRLYPEYKLVLICTPYINTEFLLELSNSAITLCIIQFLHRYHEIDSSQTLQECLRNKTIYEYPIFNITVVGKDNEFRKHNSKGKFPKLLFDHFFGVLQLRLNFLACLPPCKPRFTNFVTKWQHFTYHCCEGCKFFS